MPFLAICHFQFPLLISLISKIKNYTAIELEKWLIIILKGFIKRPVIKQSPTFLSFLFSLTAVWPNSFHNLIFNQCVIKALSKRYQSIMPYQSVNKFWKSDKILLIKMEKIGKYIDTNINNVASQMFTKTYLTS